MKNLLQTYAKELKQSKEIQKNWTKLEKFDIYVSLLFDYHCKFNFWKAD